ncbi:DUF1194 domain-containing protein [Microbaculum marinum]|uniref:DUF1194 domain-containing protein n=1 Tax=Microbaculum marinum TaxID=1764581 RepID=A0AAW9RW64_9HYPH
MRTKGIGVWVAALAIGALPAGAETRVDLELVLAIDASASVDPNEFALQVGGIASAVRDPEVQSAIAAGPVGRIAVAAIVWADATLRKQPGPWFVVDDAASAEAFAVHIESFYRRISGGTGLGSGIAEAIRLMERNGIDGIRRVVDVSGDGIETPPRENVLTLPDARGMAIGRGITVNGLAILNDVPDLDDYYRREVLVGQGAFVMAASDYDDFADAFRRKLLREIEDRPPVSRRPGAGRVDTALADPPCGSC